MIADVCKNPVRTLVALTLLATTLCVGHVLAADALVVNGRVVDVVPVMSERRYAQQEGDCAPTRPQRGAGLLDVLRWDLRADCRTVWRTEQYVDGWRVRYEWQGEIYSDVFDERPGATIPLRLTLH